MSQTQDKGPSAIEIIEQRRAVKHYDEAYKMPEADIRKLAELAATSPTAFNIQHYRFIAVTDPALRAEIRKVSFDQPQVTECSVLFVMAADVKAWDKDPARYWDRTAPEVQNGVVNAIRGSYAGKDDFAHNEALVSATLASATLMLAARAMGYGTCPMGGFSREAVAKLVGLPEDHIIAMLISVGKSLGPEHTRPGQLPLDEVLFRDRFGNK